MAQVTIYPHSGGRGSVLNDDATWSGAHDAIIGDSKDQGSFPYIEVSHFGSTKRIIRGFFTFDTPNNLPANAVITDVKFYLYVYSKTNDDNSAGHGWINVVVPNTQDSPVALLTDDFEKCGAITNPTEGATRINLSSITVGAINEFTLNTSGKSAFNPNTFSKIGVRIGNDCVNSDLITGDNTSNGVRIQIASCYVVITYTLDPKIVIRITKPTFNVLTEANRKNYIFDSDLNHLKTAGNGSFQKTVAAGASTTETVAHGLEIKPLVLAYFRSTANSNWFITMTQIEPTNSRRGINCNVEVYVDATNIYFKVNNYDASNSFTIEVKYEFFYEGS